MESQELAFMHNSHFSHMIALNFKRTFTPAPPKKDQKSLWQTLIMSTINMQQIFRFSLYSHKKDKMKRVQASVAFFHLPPICLLLQYGVMKKKIGLQINYLF